MIGFDGQLRPGNESLIFPDVFEITESESKAYTSLVSKSGFSCCRNSVSIVRRFFLDAQVDMDDQVLDGRFYVEVRSFKIRNLYRFDKYVTIL